MTALPAEEQLLHVVQVVMVHTHDQKRLGDLVPHLHGSEVVASCDVLEAGSRAMRKEVS